MLPGVKRGSIGGGERSGPPEGPEPSDVTKDNRKKEIYVGRW